MTNSRCMKKLLYIILSLIFFTDLVAQPILCDSVSILKGYFENYYHSSEYDKAISCGWLFLILTILVGIYNNLSKQWKRSFQLCSMSLGCIIWIM